MKGKVRISFITVLFVLMSAALCYIGMSLMPLKAYAKNSDANYGDNFETGTFQMESKVRLRIDGDGFAFKAKMDVDTYDGLTTDEKVYFILIPEITETETILSTGHYARTIGRYATDGEGYSKGDYNPSGSLCVYVEASAYYDAEHEVYVLQAGVGNVQSANRAVDYTAVAVIEEKLYTDSVLSGFKYTYANLPDGKDAMPSTNLYHVVNENQLRSDENYSTEIATYYDWYGSIEEYPVAVKSLVQYNVLVERINSGLDMTDKMITFADNYAADDGATALSATSFCSVTLEDSVEQETYKSFSVVRGSKVSEPAALEHSGYESAGWDYDFANAITSDTIISSRNYFIVDRTDSVLYDFDKFSHASSDYSIPISTITGSVSAVSVDKITLADGTPVSYSESLSNVIVPYSDINEGMELGEFVAKVYTDDMNVYNAKLCVATRVFVAADNAKRAQGGGRYAQVIWYQMHNTDPDGYYVLGEDIDFANVENVLTGTGNQNPYTIGYPNLTIWSCRVVEFRGTFDGRGHWLKNIKMQGLANNADLAIFANVTGTICNTRFSIIDTTDTAAYSTDASSRSVIWRANRGAEIYGNYVECILPNYSYGKDSIFSQANGALVSFAFAGSSIHDNVATVTAIDPDETDPGNYFGGVVGVSSNADNSATLNNYVISDAISLDLTYLNGNFIEGPRNSYSSYAAFKSDYSNITINSDYFTVSGETLYFGDSIVGVMDLADYTFTSSISVSDSYYGFGYQPIYSGAGSPVYTYYDSEDTALASKPATIGDYSVEVSLSVAGIYSLSSSDEFSILDTEGNLTSMTGNASYSPVKYVSDETVTGSMKVMHSSASGSTEAIWAQKLGKSASNQSNIYIVKSDWNIEAGDTISLWVYCNLEKTVDMFYGIGYYDNGFKTLDFSIEGGGNTIASKTWTKLYVVVPESDGVNGKYNTTLGTMLFLRRTGTDNNQFTCVIDDIVITKSAS